MIHCSSSDNNIFMRLQGPYIINETDQVGMTPLHFASQEGHSEIIKMLLNKWMNLLI